MKKTVLVLVSLFYLSHLTNLGESKVKPILRIIDNTTKCTDESTTYLYMQHFCLINH